jgi:hypothetical protein
MSRYFYSLFQLLAKDREVPIRDSNNTKKPLKSANPGRPVCCWFQGYELLTVEPFGSDHFFKGVEVLFQTKDGLFG